MSSNLKWNLVKKRRETERQRTKKTKQNKNISYRIYWQRSWLPLEKAAAIRRRRRRQQRSSRDSNKRRRATASESAEDEQAPTAAAAVVGVVVVVSTVIVTVTVTANNELELPTPLESSKELCKIVDTDQYSRSDSLRALIKLYT